MASEKPSESSWKDKLYRQDLGGNSQQCERDILVSTPYAIPPLHYKGLGRITAEEFDKVNNVEYAEQECKVDGEVELLPSTLNGNGGLGLFTTSAILRKGSRIGTLWGATVERLTPEYVAAVSACSLVRCSRTMTQDFVPLEFAVSAGCACRYIGVSPNGDGKFIYIYKLVHYQHSLFLILQPTHTSSKGRKTVGKTHLWSTLPRIFQHVRDILCFSLYG